MPPSFYLFRSFQAAAAVPAIKWDSAVVVAQLVERSLPITEVRSSNPAIGKNYIEHLFTVDCFEKTKIKKKRPGTAQNKTEQLKGRSSRPLRHASSPILSVANIINILRS